MRKTKQPNIVVFAALTTTTLFTWIFFEAYQILTKQDLESVPPAVLVPLSPTLDKNTLSEIESRTHFGETARLPQ